MITILFIGDGPRDHATVPQFVERLLEVTIQPRETRWARLHDDGGGRGFRRQLRFALKQAQDAGAVGIVATVDRDKALRRDRLRELEKAREEERTTSGQSFPLALGEASPHGEAWLLDDVVAVQRGLGLPFDERIPNGGKKTPKDILDYLIEEFAESEEKRLETMKAIAKEVDPKRCRSAKQTGFQQFCAEVEQELRPLAFQCGEDCRCGDACTQTSPVPDDG